MWRHRFSSSLRRLGAEPYRGMQNDALLVGAAACPRGGRSSTRKGPAKRLGGDGGEYTKAAEVGMPGEFVAEGKIVLNVSPGATSGLA